MWSDRARRVIEGVIAALPIGTPPAEQEKAVRAAYPFGERAMHPYKAWLKEVRRRFPAKAAPGPSPYVRTGPHGVLCDWCGRGDGCLACADARRRLAAFAGDRAQWRRLLIAAQEDPESRPVYADWLEEHGFDREAAAARGAWDGEAADRLLNLGAE